jgi:hypothetical protein
MCSGRLKRHAPAILCALCVSVINVHADDLRNVHVDRDNVQIRASARITIADHPIADADGNGVIHITGSGITVDFTGAHLRGADPGSEPDQFAGIGVRITGVNVTVIGGSFSGYKVGILAENADWLTVDGADVSGNFRQRLRSTPQREAAEDWLWPHHNDNREWRTNYGAGICIENASKVTVRNVRARRSQNGIILDRVNDSKVYDNDCSFLSGWGLAMWRSDRNVISRNAFDFCVRGYSHGVYNRGQDSAGILVFEQCSNNVFAENSATHGGDGFFGFAGKEALGEVNPREDLEWYKDRGCSSNIIVDNDFSYAAAHGLEITFSTWNQIWRNRFEGNAICGIWGGYSRYTQVVENTFIRNGEMGYGLERGGINIEHGVRNTMRDNHFVSNACGIHLWWDDDVDILRLRWAQANDVRCASNWIATNSFAGDRVGIELRQCGSTMGYGNRFNGVEVDLSADERSRDGLDLHVGGSILFTGLREYTPIGQTRPVGDPRRAHLAGRENIIMTEWGPYDWESPILILHERRGDRHVYRLLGVDPEAIVLLSGSEGILIGPDEAAKTVTVFPDAPGRVTPYQLNALTPKAGLTVHDVLVPATWSIRAFEWEVDPREDVDAWRAEGEATGVVIERDTLDLRFGSGDPSRALGLPQRMRADRFGTIATTRLVIPPGTWRIRTVSDDGIRVWLDGEVVIDDWTWHPPKEHVHEFTLGEQRTIDVRVEHFELDGYAVLSFDLEPLP